MKFTNGRIIDVTEGTSGRNTINCTDIINIYVVIFDLTLKILDNDLLRIMHCSCYARINICWKMVIIIVATMNSMILTVIK